MRIKTVGIVGMGALGTMYGEYLTETLGKDAVCFLMDEERIKCFREQGVTCNGKRCDFTLKAPEEAAGTIDLLVFAVKFTALDAAIESVRPVVQENTIILSVLNGIASEQILEKAYGEEKVIYSIVQGMDAVKLGSKMMYTHLGKVYIGIPKEQSYKKERLQAVVEFFDCGKLPYVIEEDIQHRMWSKFMLNVGCNQVIMVKEGTYGTIQKPGDARELMKAAMAEVLLIGEAEDINITREDLDAGVALLDTLNPEGMPSMRQDGLSKRKSEVELFSGTVIRIAAKHGIAVPVNQKLYDTITEIERTY